MERSDGSEAVLALPGGAMGPRMIIGACALLVLAGLGFAAASLVPYEAALGWLSSYSSSGSAASAFSPAMHRRLTGVLQWAAAVLAGAAAGGYWLRTQLAALAARLGADVACAWRGACAGLRQWVRTNPGEVAACALVCLAGLGLRLAYVDVPVKGDETVVWLSMANRPVPIILADYSNVGNHIFHTLLMHASWLALGEGSLAMRLPALVAGALLVPATYFAARIAYGGPTALIAAVLVAGTSILVEYSVNSRGYMLQSLLIVGVFAAAQLLLLREASSRWAALVLLLALAMWTLPTSGIACAGIAAWVGANVILRDGRAAWRRLLRFAGAAAAAAVLTLLLYGPALLAVGFDPLLTMLRSGSSDVSQGLAGALADLWQVWTRSLPVPVGWLALGLMAWGVVRERRHGTVDVPLGFAFAGWLVAFYLILWTIGYGRLWLPFVPFVCIMVAIGAVDLAGEAQCRFRPVSRDLARRLALSLPLLLLMVLAGLELRGRYAALPDGDSFLSGSELAALLPALARPGESVLAMQPMGSVVAYEMRRQGLGFHYRNLPRPPAGSGRTVLAIGPAGVQLPPSFLVVLRSDGQGLDYVLGYFGLPGGSAAPQLLRSFPGGILLRVVP